MTAKSFNLHLVSDSTGETILSVARACVVQFGDFEAKKYLWPMVRGTAALDEALTAIESMPGPVLFTLVDDGLRAHLVTACGRLGVPCIPLLDQVMGALANYLGAKRESKPGRQHAMDAEYFARIEAMQYVLAHDDGQGSRALDDADVILVGVSRTSKTPTCVYLANRGIKAANVPLIAGLEPPAELLACRRPLIVGLTTDAQRLIQVRRNRLRAMNEADSGPYVDIDSVTQELRMARQLCARHGWPVLDVTRRSIEETAAAVLQLLKRREPGAVAS
ncbi:MAG: pyruvate, water dikinase regulatory protein [Alphaproteobacteria bacterium]